MPNSSIWPIHMIPSGATVTYPYINTWNIRICKNVDNVHKHRMFIRIGIRKIRNTDDSLGTGTTFLLPSLSLGFRHEKSETQFFYADCLSIVSFQLTDSTNAHTRTPQFTHSTGLTQVWKINLLRLSPNLNSLLLFKITKNPCPSLPGMTSFTSPVLFSIWGFYCDICDWHILPAHVWTSALNVCT